MADSIQRVAVIGAGTMGLGIAQVAAMAGYAVQLFDARADAVDKALGQIDKNLQQGVARGKVSPEAAVKTLSLIDKVEQLHEINADLAIEAIVEELGLKQNLLAELEKILPEEALICTNTSSIAVTKIAAGLKFRHRFLGMHFFNPAHIMKLVEVVATSETNEKALQQALAFVSSLGKVPVVANDSPGFIVNRVARHFYVESLRVLEEQVASFEDIDKLLEASGFRMGPFRLMDLIGVDTNFAVTSTMYQGFHQDPKFRPSRIQEQKVAAGHLGKKTGRGFYRYE